MCTPSAFATAAVGKFQRTKPRLRRARVRADAGPETAAVAVPRRSVRTPAVAPVEEKRGAPPVWLTRYLGERKAEVDAAIDEAVAADNAHSAGLVDSMRYSLLAGGKRIRPILAIASYEMFKGVDAERSNTVMPAALAVEMIHTMSLIHDDLPCMDNDDFRRGRPTNHKVYGDNMAVLAGDALLALSFEHVAKHTKHVDAQRVVKVLELLGNAVGAEGLAGGQAVDVKMEGKDVTLDTLRWIHTHKTAVLLRVSVAIGAIVAGASEQDVARVSEFAGNIGLAFQIADDVLDVTASTEALGKTAGKDQAVDKATFPKLLGIEESRAAAGELVREAKELLKPFGERANTLLALADFIIERNN